MSHNDIIITAGLIFAIGTLLAIGWDAMHPKTTA
jgi:hypothetical protein